MVCVKIIIGGKTMIIKMNQTSRDKSGLSMGIGGFNLQVTPDGGTDYEFIYNNNNIYGHFNYQKISRNEALMKSGGNLFNLSHNLDDYRAVFNGRSSLNINVRKVDCPSDFEESMVGYYRQIDDKTKCFFRKEEHVYTENNQVVGILREYIIGTKKKIFSNFTYYDAINYKGQNYFLYPLKLDHYYLCVYNNNTLIAIIMKESTLFKKDNYTIYALDGSDADFLCMMAAKFDYTYFQPVKRQDSEGHMVTEYSTPDFAFKRQRLAYGDKFDSNFIERIKNGI